MADRYKLIKFKLKAIDTHAHLDQLKNLQQVLEDAYQAGVEGIVSMSMDAASCRKNLEIQQAKVKTDVYIAMGMHPSEANLNDLEACLELARKHSTQLTAIGEIGLDFWYKWVRKDQEKKGEQRKVFRRFLEFANEVNLPVVIHSRGVWRECFDTAKSVGVKKANFHWYSGPLEVLKNILDEGYFVSTTPSVSYSPQSREAMRYAPIEQTLIETDCPVYYKNRQTEEGFQAEPKDVFRTLKSYCLLKNIDEQKALEILNNNAKEFFGIEPKGEQ